ncbi:MAG: serine/threonine-protein kinase [Polaromonas sp.]
MSLKKLGRYDLIRVLGKGAMGLVYEGRDPNLDRRVAIKTIKVENLSEEAAAEYEVRFRTEARSAARLQHPHIVSVYDSDRDGDIAFLVMEFIAGDDLKHHLDKGDLYTLEQTLGIMGDLLSALDYAHKQSIVHRDIKPANLLIETNGRVKLTDFGVARIQDSGEATRTQGSMVGTLKYMSPEQVQGRPIDARADLFAAGIVLYQLLTGKRPFDGDTDFATIQQIVGHTPVMPSAFNARLPAALDAVVAKALAKSRDQRYASAQEFLTALQAAAREAPDTSVLPPAVPPGPGSNSTWTSTLLAGEALVDLQSGTSANISVVTQELELVYWKDIKESMDVEDFHAFLAKFPSGIYADLARRRLRKLGTPGADDSDIGRRLGTGTLVVPRPGTQPGQPAPGMATANGTSTDQAWNALEEAAANTPSPPPVPARPAADDPDATRLGAPAAATVKAPAAEVDADISLDWPETVFSDPVVSPAVSEQRGAQPAKPAAATTASPAAGPKSSVSAASAAAARSSANAADASSVRLKSARKRSPSASPMPAKAGIPKSSYLFWGAAGVVALVVVAAGWKSLSGRNVPAAAQVAAAPVETPATAEAPAATSPAQATPVAPKAAEPAVQAQSAASLTPPASSAAVVRAPLTAASKAQLAAAVAAKRAALEKERQAKQAQTKPAVAAPSPAATDRAAAPAAAATAAAAGNPQQACEGRILLGFQICMSEQCAKPGFAQQPVCVERRAMEQRRRDQSSNR